jgi:hypothetical protein
VSHLSRTAPAAHNFSIEKVHEHDFISSWEALKQKHNAFFTSACEITKSMPDILCGRTSRSVEITIPIQKYLTAKEASASLVSNFRIS